ncbi:Retrotransposon gag domain-containing protein [Plasmodiophora brassicae]|uniref:Retrotransposon gag domain-containing protein n=1 Tax=Plasmodiophora brassicae TaxID=37360 RepID=A0A3P3YN74_PLABS|nr:unnamed protein product [Plasmodiophora brassicae]
MQRGGACFREFAEATQATRPVSMPSNLPTFKRRTTNPLTTWSRSSRTASKPTAGYPKARYVQALNASSDADLTWSEARERFLGHYLDSDILALHQEAYESIAMGVKESVLAFADRYLKVMRLAEQDPDARSRVKHFTLRLPAKTQDNLKVLKCARPESVRSERAIVNALTTLHADEHQGVQGQAVGATTGKDPKASATSSTNAGATNTAKKWCAHHES